jgi:hypothetical protein
MATIFETIYCKELQGTQVQISRKDMNWTGRELRNNRFEHEKIDTTPYLRLRLTVPFEDIQRISDYADNFWTQPSKAKAGDVRLTNAQLYEYQLRKVLDEAIAKLETDWQKTFEQKLSKMATKTETQTA